MQVTFCFDARDQTIQRFINSGFYSVKSSTETVYARQIIHVENQRIFTNIWRGLGPSRVEIMVWFAILNRLSTMDQLMRFNIIQKNSKRHVLCNLLEEFSNHLFLHCMVVRKIWGTCLDQFGLSWSMSSNLSMHMESWFVVDFKGAKLKNQYTLLFMVIWSIW